MKNLLILSAGVALGYLLKKPKVQSPSKFMIVDDRESFDLDLSKPQAQQAIKIYLSSRSKL